MSTSDYPDYPPQRNRKHRVTVGDATFIVTSNVNGNTRWIREVHHVRRHRSGSSADVCIYPNGSRKPSGTLASLWAHLGIDPTARWKECAADHPAFPARRSIETAQDRADDDRKACAAAAVLVAAGWTWAEGEDERWIAPPAQAVDLPYSLDADPAGIRARVADVITGTLMVGAQGHTPPPTGHWAEPFWQAARADAKAQAIDPGPLRRLYKAYVRLLESGRDRIIDLGGSCDPVDVMERSDADLIEARALIDGQAVQS